MKATSTWNYRFLTSIMNFNTPTNFFSEIEMETSSNAKRIHSNKGSQSDDFKMNQIRPPNRVPNRDLVYDYNHIPNCTNSMPYGYMPADDSYNQHYFNPNVMSSNSHPYMNNIPNQMRGCDTTRYVYPESTSYSDVNSEMVFNQRGNNIHVQNMEHMQYHPTDYNNQMNYPVEQFIPSTNHMSYQMTPDPLMNFPHRATQPPVSLNNTSFKSNSGEFINIEAIQQSFTPPQTFRSHITQKGIQGHILSNKQNATRNYSIPSISVSMPQQTIENRSIVVPNEGSMMPSFNSQMDFLAKNPQYLSSLAVKSKKGPGENKVSRAVAAQLFRKDEVTERFPCKGCGQSFKRINSLKRHIMNHLSIKPYKCDGCGKGFCRIDVYKRHASRGKCKAQDADN